MQPLSAPLCSRLLQCTQGVNPCHFYLHEYAAVSFSGAGGNGGTGVILLDWDGQGVQPDF